MHRDGIATHGHAACNRRNPRPGKIDGGRATDCAEEVSSCCTESRSAGSGGRAGDAAGIGAGRQEPPAHGNERLRDARWRLHLQSPRRWSRPMDAGRRQPLQAGSAVEPEFGSGHSLAGDEADRSRRAETAGEPWLRRGPGRWHPDAADCQCHQEFPRRHRNAGRRQGNGSAGRPLAPAPGSSSIGAEDRSERPRGGNTGCNFGSLGGACCSRAFNSAVRRFQTLCRALWTMQLQGAERRSGTMDARRRRHVQGPTAVARGSPPQASPPQIVDSNDEHVVITSSLSLILSAGVSHAKAASPI